MNFKNTKEFFVIETIIDDGQYLCEYLINSDTNEVSIHNTTRDIHSKRIAKFDTLDSANKALEAIRGCKYANEPRVLSVKAELSIEEA